MTTDEIKEVGTELTSEELTLDQKIDKLKNDAIKANVRGDHESLAKIISQLDKIFLDDKSLQDFYKQLEKTAIAKGD